MKRKLSDEDVIRIRELAKKPYEWTHKRIAKQFDVVRQTVSAIVSGKARRLKARRDP